MLDHDTFEVATSRAAVKALRISRPRRSSGSAAAWATDGIRLHPTATAINPTGRLARKTARHPSVLTRAAATAGLPMPMMPHTDDMRA